MTKLVGETMFLSYLNYNIDLPVLQFVDTYQSTSAKRM